MSSSVHHSSFIIHRLPTRPFGHAAKKCLVTLALAVITGCAATPPATQPAVPIVDQSIATTFDPGHVPGPTVMAKVAGGYELTNTLYRVVISDQTGDVIFWGYKDQGRNMVFHRGMYTTLTALPDAPMHGYVEKRDEQTWQFYGDDDKHITWRKIYCLEGDRLFVSIIIQNNRPDALYTAIQLNGELIGLSIDHHDPELFQGHGGYGSIQVRGWNEFHAPASQPILPVILQSDVFHLKAGERQGWTTEWKISP